MFGAIAREYRSNFAARPRLWPRLLAVLELWRHRAETRADLEGLPPELLRDIGLTPAEAKAEAKTPFWR